MSERVQRPKARAVDPIVDRKEVERLKEYMLESSKDRTIALRNYMLVVIGVNFGLRASDLCRLKVGDVRDKDYLDIIEQKTKKRRVLRINDAIKKVIREYLDGFIFVSDAVYLFESGKGGYIQPRSLHKLIKSAGRHLGWRGNYGSHTLRKTMAYHVLQANKADPDVLQHIMLMFNHSHESVTKRYLASSSVVDDCYDCLNL